MEAELRVKEKKKVDEISTAQLQFWLVQAHVWSNF
jgi:hypothetical protein